MKIQIYTNDNRVITSDVLTCTKQDLVDKIAKALTGEGYLQFHVENLLTFIPYGVLNTSIIQIIE